ncbi:MAG: YdeI/OmpD-associated family protein [Myxococcota bacterium]
MSEPNDEHAFRAAISFDEGQERGYMKHFVPLPAAVARAFEAAGVDRLEGQLGALPFRRKLARTTAGTPCVKLGEGWLRDAGLEVGDVLSVVVWPDPEPDRVDVPEALAEALARDPEVEAFWATLTPGKRRTLTYPIARAKRPATQEKRAEALLEQLRDDLRRAPR